MDLKLIAPLKRLNLIVETYPVWCKIMMHFVCTLLLMFAGGLRIIVIKEVQNYLFNKNILLFISGVATHWILWINPGAASGWERQIVITFYTN